MVSINGEKAGRKVATERKGLIYNRRNHATSGLGDDQSVAWGPGGWQCEWRSGERRVLRGQDNGNAEVRGVQATDLCLGDGEPGGLG